MGEDGRDSGSKIAQRATAITGKAISIGKDIATGMFLPKLVLKLIILAVVLVIFFVILVACMFYVIFWELGFDGATEYAAESYAAETENLTGVITTYYSDAANRAAADSIFTDGVLPEIAGAIEENYNSSVDENTDEHVVYDGYEVDNGYDTFWSTGAYADSFVAIVQDKCNTSDISSIENNDTAVLDTAITTYLASNASGWVDWERLEDITWTEEVYEMTGTQAVTVTEERQYYQLNTDTAAVFQHVSGTTKYYLDELDTLDALTYAELMNSVNEHPDWWGPFTETTSHEETEEVWEYVAYTHITANYQITVGGYASAGVDTQDAEYAYVEDEDTMQAAIDLLEAVTEGKIFKSVINIFKLGRAAIRAQIDMNALNKLVSWRTTTSSTSLTVLSSGSGIAYGDTSLGAKAAECALAHINDIYSQGQRTTDGYVDCSSLMAKAYKEAGDASLCWLTAAGEAEYCVSSGSVLEADSLQAGDLIFSSSGSNGRYLNISHVGMYLGDYDGDGAAEVINAVGTGKGVKIADFDSYISSHNVVMYGRPYQASVAENIQSVDDIYTFLTVSCGFTKAGACGVLGNLMVETGFNPTAGSPSTHYGLVQWDPGRYANLVAYCETYGFDYASLDGQLNFMLYEMQSNSTYKKVYNYLKTATDPQMAAQEVAVGYEGCVGTTGHNDAKYTGSLFPSCYGKYYQALGSRMSYAQAYYNEY
ncbi:MAG: phage tail tip lysozyme [Clostridiales bacterium]|nr:phage tail tip lysozyme [Clostridiales bacterium]